MKKSMLSTVYFYVSVFTGRMWWLLLLIGFANESTGQSNVFTEPFGTTNTLPENWSVSSADWKCNNTAISTGYPNASGGSNMEFVNNNTNEQTLTYSGLSTLNYNNITVLWGARHISLIGLLSPIAVTLSYSTDGTTWTSVAFNNLAITLGGSWALVNNGTRIALPAGAANAANLRLRFTAKAGSAGANTNYRIDDVTVQGCRINTGALSYAGPFCQSVTAAQAVTLTNGTTGGTYSAAPAGLIINTTTGAITPSSSTAGTYTVSYAAPAIGSCPTPTTSTTQVTITAVPTATISYAGSPYCSDAGTASVTLNGNGNGSFSSTSGLFINTSTGAVNTNASTAGTYTVSYTIPASDGCGVVTATAPITISTAGIWTGAISSDFSSGGNWQCGSIPLSTTAIFIPAGLSVYPVIDGTVAATNISIASGARLTVLGNLQVAGTITGSGKMVAVDGTLEFTGTTAQSIPAGLFENALVKNLTISNAAGVSMTDTVKLTGLLKITAGQFNTTDKLVLKSTAASTAMVAAITSAATTPVNGKVTVERSVPGRRKYRLMTSPVTTSTAATLSAGQENLSIWGAWQNGGNNTAGNTGTFITGGSSADGFDPQTTNASLFTYDDINRRYVGFTTANSKKTKYTPLKAGVAYYMFVYGDRINTITTNTPNPTVLSATGTLLIGDQVYTTASAIPLSPVVGRFTLLGNPFASAINWSTLPKTNLDNAYWGWDPNLSNTGGYVTVFTSGTVTLQAPYTGSTGLNQYIQPGQGFFVKTTAASPALTIREQDKVTNLNTNAFRITGNDRPGLLAVNLLYNSSASRVLADGVLLAFHDGMAASGEGTAIKIPNPTAENIAIQQDSSWLSIHTRPTPRTGDTLRLSLWRLTRLQYTLQIFAQQLATPGLQAFLYDKYRDTLQPLSLADTNTIAFDVVPGVAASADTNRFRIVFRSGSGPLPVKFISVAATPTAKNIQLNWGVAAETGIRQYNIEKATNGTDFKAVGTLEARGNSTSTDYRWTDTTPQSGNNYYRIKALEKDGKFTQSETVLAKWAATDFTIRLSPNPFTGGNLTLYSGALEKGRYSIEVMNASGSRVFSRDVPHTGGVLAQTISFDAPLPAGMYYLTITQNGSSRRYLPLIVQ